MRESVVTIRKKNPCATLAQIGDKVGISRERVRQILKSEGGKTRHLDIKHQYYCLNCAKVFKSYSSKNPKWCSLLCRHEYSCIPVTCNICGKLFRKKQSALVAQSNDSRYRGNDYCSRKCFGVWVGKNIGILPSGGRKRIYNYVLVEKLYLDNMSYKDMSQIVGCSTGVLGLIIHKLRKERGIDRPQLGPTSNRLQKGLKNP